MRSIGFQPFRLLPSFKPQRSILVATEPHTLITDNGAQFTSDLFEPFASKYKFQHITSSPYWSQSNGSAEAAIKSAKHILHTADDVELALLFVCNRAPAGHAFSLTQRLFGRQLHTNLTQPALTLTPSMSPPDIVIKTWGRKCSRNVHMINMQDNYSQILLHRPMSMIPVHL